MNATCIGAHDTDPPLPEPGSMLCRRCRQRLLRALNAITELWPLLSVMLTPGNATSGGSHGKPASRPPCSVDVMDITDPYTYTHLQAHETGTKRVCRLLLEKKTYINQHCKYFI